MKSKNYLFKLLNIEIDKSLRSINKKLKKNQYSIILIFWKSLGRI
jgi:hypothetical protein